MNFSRYQVKPGKKVDLSRHDPNDRTGWTQGKQEARRTLLRLNRELGALQELLYAGHEHRMLIVLQATDTGGKDGVIRHVFRGVNPQGVRVAVFKQPTAEELDHDYLWRIHPHVPGKGQIVIFNRSHYEDVLAVRVRGLAPKKVWSKRYDHINAFEGMLADEGCTILKFFLHIDAGEQKKRLQARLDDPRKAWKFNPSDLDDRANWERYQRAYADMLGETSTAWAPWRIVPANRKWHRNLVVASTIVETLKGLKMQPPPVTFDPANVTIDDPPGLRDRSASER